MKHECLFKNIYLGDGKCQRMCLDQYLPDWTLKQVQSISRGTAVVQMALNREIRLEDGSKGAKNDCRRILEQLHIQY